MSVRLRKTAQEWFDLAMKYAGKLVESSNSAVSAAAARVQVELSRQRAAGKPGLRFIRTNGLVSSINTCRDRVADARRDVARLKRDPILVDRDNDNHEAMVDCVRRLLASKAPFI